MKNPLEIRWIRQDALRSRYLLYYLQNMEAELKNQMTREKCYHIVVTCDITPGVEMSR